jgi:hypothetical protein
MTIPIFGMTQALILLKSGIPHRDKIPLAALKFIHRKRIARNRSSLDANKHAAQERG